MNSNSKLTNALSATVALMLLFSAVKSLKAEDKLEAETSKIATEDAPTTSPGNLELEVAYGHSEANRYFDQSNQLKDRKVAVNNEVRVKATYGILENFDTSLSYGWASLIDAEDESHDGQGSGDTGLGFKWNFYSCEESGIALSYMPTVILPTGESGTSTRLGISQEYYSVDQLLVLTYSSDAFTMNADSGFVLPFGDEREEFRGDFLADLAFGYQITEWLQPEVELNYAHGYTKNDTDSDCLAITAGFIMNIAENLRIDLGAQQAIYGRKSDLYTAVVMNISHTF